MTCCRTTICQLALLARFLLVVGTFLWLNSQLAAGKDPQKLTARLEKLQESKLAFEGTYSSEIQKLQKAFDDLAAMADGAAQIPYLDRQAIVADLKQARQEFTNRGSFAKIPAMQQSYVSFIVSILASYQSLMREYQQVLAALSKDDPRSQTFKQEIDATTERVAKYDSLKKGTVLIGIRQDYNWGPVQGLVEGPDAIRFKRINNPRVEAEIRLKITERQGTMLTGRLNQGGFVAEVAGNYDGLNLRFKVVRVLKGAPRHFEYSGQLAGQIGILDLVGIKKNGLGTTGKLVLERP